MLPQFLIFGSQRVGILLRLRLLLQSGMLQLVPRRRNLLPDHGGSLLNGEVGRMSLGNGSLLNLVRHLVNAVAARRGWPRKTRAKMTRGRSRSVGLKGR